VISKFFPAIGTVVRPEVVTATVVVTAARLRALCERSNRSPSRQYFNRHLVTRISLKGHRLMKLGVQRETASKGGS
jgi:hypothetical protein